MAAGARVFGFFDTPWSRAGSPPFTSVSVDIPAMVTSAMTMLDALRAGNEPREKSLTIPPRLVERG
jgi:DNA-binding LacI/PurR family transcriptional regulator